MIQRKIIYSKIALEKRKAIKREIKEKYGQIRADKFSKYFSRTITNLKKFPGIGISLREKYGLDCDYEMLIIDHNYVIYRVTQDKIFVLEIFNEKEDFMYQMFGIVTTSQETLDYWNED